MSARKWQREMLAVARELGIVDARVEFGGSHPRIVGTYKNKPVKAIIANAPTCWYASRKVRRDLERAIRA